MSSIAKMSIYCTATLTLLAVGVAGQANFPVLTTGAAFAQNQATPVAPAVKKNLPPSLAEIARATTVEDGNLKSGKLRESLLAAEKLTAASREDVIDVALNATPAGRLFGLALLRKIDAGQYEKLAAQARNEIGEESVSYVSPTERCHYSVADILNDMASPRPLIKMLP